MSLYIDVVAVLGAITDRLQAGRSEAGARAQADLTPGVPLIADLGRLNSRGKTDDLRSLQSSIAAVREQLDLGEVSIQAPMAALRGKMGEAYLAGALWSANEFIAAELAARDADLLPGSDHAATRKARINEVVRSALLAAAQMNATISQVDVVDLPAAAALSARRDEVSRAFSDLVATGFAEEIRGSADSDRRRKHYRFTGSAEETAERDDALRVNRRTVPAG